MRAVVHQLNQSSNDLLRYVAIITRHVRRKPASPLADIAFMHNKRVSYPRSMRQWLGVLVLVSVPNCTKPNPNKDCSSNVCPDPAYPYCDVEGAISGEPQTCISVTCEPGSVAACLEDVALTCNATGNGYDRVQCSLGCVDSEPRHCAYIEPRYVPDICDSPATEDSLIVSSSASFDPNLDSNCTGGLVEQPGAPPICVVHYRRISIPTDKTLTVIGVKEMSGRPVAFVADEDLEIEGTLDVGAHGYTNGPGGGVVQSGGQFAFTSTTSCTAGGGAGGRTAGGAGGNNTADGGSANGGLVMADPALLAAFIGGASAFKADGFIGGGGGGAVTLISCRGLVSISGAITAGGGGGLSGEDGFFDTPGGGGGAGGYVVLQGGLVSVTGGVFANGGGGGGGMPSSGNGQSGQDGTLSDVSAAQGGFPQNGEGRGGPGGVGTGSPGMGGKPTSAYPASCGGGGGSVGFLQTYTPRNVIPALTPSQVSPPFQPNVTIRTR